MSPRLPFYLLAVVAGIGLAAFSAYDLARERAMSLSAAQHRVAGIALLLEAHVRQVLRRAESTLVRAPQYVGAAPPAGGPAPFVDLLPGDGLVQRVEWWAPDGVLLATSDAGAAGPAPPPAPARGLALEPAARDAAGAGWITARRRAPAGGTLVARLDPGYLQPVFDAIDVGHDGFAGLFGDGGALIAGAAARGDVDRVQARRELPDYPVTVGIGIAQADVLADWRNHARREALLLVAVALLLGAAALAMARHRAQREAAERAEAEGSRHTQAIVEHVADAIVGFGADGLIESANPAAERLFGYAPGALIGHPVQTVVPELLPSQRPDAGADQRVETEGRRSDGRRLPLALSVTGIERRGGPRFVALMRDITEQRRAQVAIAEGREQAEANERFLREITDNVPLRIAFVDAQLRYRFVNKAICERFQLPRERILGRTREEVLGTPLQPAVREAVQKVLTGELDQYEYVEDLHGRVAIVECYAVPALDEAGQVRGFFDASADVTERRAQERRIADALAERETLLREVYHRVKNNLQVIQSLLSLQRRALPPGDARRALDDSVQRVAAMALVHEKLYQADNLSAVALPDYVRDLLRQIGDAAGVAQRGIVLRADVAPVEASLEASVPFGLLVAELVGNSLKHAFPGGRRGSVEVRLQRRGAVLALAVADDGVGLPAGFELARATSMGLQLAASLAGQLGGQLQAHRAGGAVFETFLPRLG